MEFHRGVERGAAVGLGDGDFRIALYGECVCRDLFAINLQRDLVLPWHHEWAIQTAASAASTASAPCALLLNARPGKRLHAQIPERGVDASVSLAFQRLTRKFARHLAR